MILTTPLPPQTMAPGRPGPLGREIAPRNDRIPRDARVDLPEIEESFRVSFSNESRAAAGQSQHDPLRAPLPGDRRLAAYVAVANLTP